MEVCKKNWSKVRALYALRLQKLSGVEWSGAGEISDMAGVGRHSLYVLLGRWRRWRLVKCDRFSTPLQYALACRGQHYLNQLPAWYEQRELAYQLVCDNVKPSLYWCSVNQWSKQVTKLHFLTYPFKTAADYRLVKPNADGRFIYTGESMVRIKRGNALQAVYGIRDVLGLTWGSELIEFMLGAGFITRRRGGEEAVKPGN